MSVEATEQPLAESERWIVRNGIGIQIMETLAVGAFLTALAVELGASNLTIGILAAIPHLAQLAQIPALLLVEKVRQRRKVYAGAGFIARPMFLVIALAVFIPDASIALVVITIAFAVRYVGGAFLGCAWSSWMRDLVPDQDMGRLFSRRQQYMIGVGIGVGLTAAAFLDLWKNFVPLPTTAGYAIVYAIAFVGGLYSVVCARRIHEPPMQPATSETHPLQRLAEPFRDRNYRRLIKFLTSWNFAINLATPFFTVHMLKRMDLDLVWVVGFATLSQVAAFLVVRQWGAIADRFNNKSVLQVCVPLFVLAIFGWTFTTMPDPHAFTIPLLVLIHIVTGIASAGVTLASGNIALKLAPIGDATTYLAAIALVNAVASGTAAMLGGLTADVFATWQLSLTLNWQTAQEAIELDALVFSHWDFFFFSATVVGLYALHRLSMVVEEGEVEEALVVDALVASAKESLRSVSTVGMRIAADFPVAMIDVAFGQSRRERRRASKEPREDGSVE